MWVTRLTHELEEWGSDALFLTLTYKEMPVAGSLDKQEFQRFMKRLRKDLSGGARAGEARKVKYYACGEYGSDFERPHYHLILFGLGKADCRWDGGLRKYRCPIVEDNWGHGIVDVGSVTSASMRYVANYIGKAFLGDSAIVYNGREPPFSLMSKGMGLSWALRNRESIVRNGLTKGGKAVRIPRYYVGKLDLVADLDFMAERTELHNQRIAGSSGVVPKYREVLDSVEVSRAQAVLNESGKDSVKKKKKGVF